MSITAEASRIASCFTNSRVINSLGANPVRGGRPARDNKMSMMVVERAGFFDHEAEICDIFVVDITVSDINIAAVMMIYKIKLKRAS